MPEYVDGFVVPVPKKNLKAYKAMAQKASKIWMEYGALAYYEAAGDDMNVSFGLPFPKLAKLKKDETVVFAWIVYKSKKHRNAVNKKVMADERMHDMCDPKNPPFNFKKMAYGGFEVMVKG
jgi:uncharacterized protein YbaA (DUF1428 family)